MLLSHKNTASQNSTLGSDILEPEISGIISSAGDNDCYQRHENLPLKGFLSTLCWQLTAFK